MPCREASKVWIDRRSHALGETASRLMPAAIKSGLSNVSPGSAWCRHLLGVCCACHSVAPPLWILWADPAVSPSVDR